MKVIFSFRLQMEEFDEFDQQQKFRPWLHYFGDASCIIERTNLA
jgi:hypothetical protein